MGNVSFSSSGCTLFSGTWYYAQDLDSGDKKPVGASRGTFSYRRKTPFALSGARCRIQSDGASTGEKGGIKRSDDDLGGIYEGSFNIAASGRNIEEYRVALHVHSGMSEEHMEICGCGENVLGHFAFDGELIVPDMTVKLWRRYSQHEQCPVLRPTADQFFRFGEYIANLDAAVKQKGIVRIIPPLECRMPTLHRKDLNDITVETPIQQVCIKNSSDSFRIENVPVASLPFGRFEEYSRGQNRIHLVSAEKEFWKSFARYEENPPVYGADILGSVGFDDQACEWNWDNLDCALRSAGLVVGGVTRPMLYFGSPHAMFVLHTEDVELYSINFLHAGSPKFWYGISPEHRSKVQQLARQLFSGDHQRCAEFLRHKKYLITPSRLKASGIPVVRTMHSAGEIMVTFPGAFHFGFNTGFNIAESQNFLPSNPASIQEWLDHAAKYGRCCKCRPGAVDIDTDFLQAQWKLLGLLPSCRADEKNAGHPTPAKRRKIERLSKVPEIVVVNKGAWSSGKEVFCYGRFHFSLKPASKARIDKILQGTKCAELKMGGKALASLASAPTIINVDLVSCAIASIWDKEFVRMHVLGTKKCTDRWMGVQTIHIATVLREESL